MQVGRRSGVVARYEIQFAAAFEGSPIARKHAQCLTTVRDCPIKIAPGNEGDAPVTVGGVIVRIESDGFAAILDDLVELALGCPGCSSVAVPIDELGIEAERLGVVGLEAQCLLQAGPGLGQPTLRLQGNAQLVMGHGVVRLEAHGLAEESDGLFVLAHLAGEQAQQEQRLDVVGIGLEDGAVQLLSLS